MSDEKNVNIEDADKVTVNPAPDAEETENVDPTQARTAPAKTDDKRHDTDEDEGTGDDDPDPADEDDESDGGI